MQKNSPAKPPPADLLVTITDGECRTTTLAIAEGTGSEHASVIKLVRTYLSDLEEFGRVGFEIAPFETAGGTQKREYALLNEHQSTLLMTYMKNTEIIRAFKKRLVKAFYEMSQNRPAQIDLNDPANLRNALLTYTEKVLELESKVGEQVVVITELTPKAAAHDLLSTSEGSLCVTDAAKNLQIKPSTLFGYLSGAGWIYRRAGSITWIAYQGKLQQGLLEHKINVMQRPDAPDKITEQVRVTPKGLARLAELFGAQKAA